MEKGPFLMSKPNLAQAAQLAEIIASICVVASLIWVALELDMNTKEVRASNAFQITAFAVDNRLRSIEIGISELIVKADANEPLTPREQLDLTFYYQYIYQEIELVHHQYTEERLDIQVMEAWERRLVFSLSDPVGRSQWESNKIVYSDKFRAYVESLLNDT
jgi:hypothetical protein